MPSHEIDINLELELDSLYCLYSLLVVLKPKIIDLFMFYH